MVKLLGAEPVLDALDQSNLKVAQQALLKAVALSMREPAPAPVSVNLALNLLATTGEKVTRLARLLWLLSGFIGQTLSTIFYILPRPRRWRFTPFVAAIHDTGLNALPIVALLTFLVGAVVAFLGATVLEDFGATIYTVDLVAFSFLREF